MLDQLAEYDSVNVSHKTLFVDRVRAHLEITALTEMAENGGTK